MASSLLPVLCACTKPRPTQTLRQQDFYIAQCNGPRFPWHYQSTSSKPVLVYARVHSFNELHSTISQISYLHPYNCIASLHCTAYSMGNCLTKPVSPQTSRHGQDREVLASSWLHGCWRLWEYCHLWENFWDYLHLLCPYSVLRSEEHSKFRNPGIKLYFEFCVQIL